MKIVFALCLFIVFYSCSNGPESETEYISYIEEVEDSLNKMSTDASQQKMYTETQQRYLNTLLEFYQKYPKSKDADRSLDKVHMIYSGMGDYENSVKWADTLLMNYPKYVNRAMVLESQANSYDVFLQPRDTTMVRKYYTMLLNEFPLMDKTKRADIQDRLKHNKLTLEQYMSLQVIEPELIN